MPPLIREPRHDGLRIYRDGVHVGTIPFDDLPALLVQVAMMLRHRPET